MKKKDWERRLPFDLAGVQLLGAALLARAEYRLHQASGVLAECQNSDDPMSDVRWPHGPEYYKNEVEHWKREHSKLSECMEVLGTSKQTIEESKSLRIWDFRFRWDQLRDHCELVGYLSDDQPSFAALWDRETPISKRWGDNAVSALESILSKECHRLTGPNPDDTPALRHEKDFLFYLTVWKFCEPEKGRGQPKGRRWADGLRNAASYAYSIRGEAEEAGSPISTEEAIRQSLEFFEIIPSSEFDAHLDKESTVVSNAVGGYGAMDGAIKAVRKMLSEFDKGDMD